MYLEHSDMDMLEWDKGRSPIWIYIVAPIALFFLITSLPVAYIIGLISEVKRDK